MLPIFAIILIITLTVDKGSCEVVHNDRQGRILGGLPVRSSEASHYVFLYRMNRSFYCSGTLLTAQYVLTAKHCLIDKRKSIDIAFVRAGLSYSKNNLRRVKDIYVPPGRFDWSTLFWGENKINGDIAILKVDSPFILSKNVRTVKLPTQLPVMYEPVTVYGFGATDYGLRNKLTNVNKLSGRVTNCSDEPVYYDEICTYSPTGGFCDGDSGTGLINRKREVIGVASRNLDCGISGLDIYSGVYFHLNFIYNVLYESEY